MRRMRDRALTSAAANTDSTRSAGPRTLPPMRALAFALALPVAVIAELVPVPEHGIRIERGFRVSLFSDEKLANDIWCMTLNPRDEVVVSGAGYIRTLLDADGDGRADKAVEFAKLKGGAMGLCFDESGKQLLVMADGWLSEYRDDNLDRTADGPPRKLFPFASGEHGGHAIRRGPDGWWWCIGGNDAGIAANTHILSPDDAPAKVRIPERRSVSAGAILRISSDFSTSEVMADGFRNPYDFDFNERGAVFTYDSDCERDYFLPWYSGCRVYHVRIGEHHGWRLPGYQRSFRVPDYMPDVVPALADLGRGSPTGVHVYKGTAFPKQHHGGLFVADWTFGRIWHLPLRRQTIPRAPGDAPEDAKFGGALSEVSAAGFVAEHSLEESYVTQPEIFIEPIGTAGFAPTDIVETKAGALLVSIGGRKTRGAVFHITRTAEVADIETAVLSAATRPPRTLEVLARFQSQLGGWKIEGASAEAFVPYEPVNPNGIRTDERKAAADFARDQLLSLDDRARTEAARLLAMLADDSAISASRILADITEKSPPTADFHHLACFARLRTERTPEHTVKVAHAILGLDRKLAGGDRRPKQNWAVRLNEVAARLIERDPPLADALALSPEFGRDGHIALVDALPLAKRANAARRFLAAMRFDASRAWTPQVVRVLGTLDEARPLIRERWLQRELRPAIRDVLKRNPSAEDRALLDEKESPPADPGDLAAFAESLKTIAWEKGDAARGAKLFTERSCGACHGGPAPLGADLAGPVARLSAAELMTEIQFPSRNIAEAFRSTLYTLRDGTQVNGLLSFLSADGVILQSGPGITLRIAESDIASREEAAVSLMPPALLSGLRAEELADLYAYMRSLAR
jgi:putative heme-binding domain-containing protein